MSSFVRRALRATRDAVLGRPSVPIMSQIIRRDPRSTTFFAALDYINYERVPGDVIEFGVFTGLSLAEFAAGDSFEGLPPSATEHARWVPTDCAINHSWHPLIPIGAPVSADVTRNLFAACGLPEPTLHIGQFDQTIAKVIPSVYPSVALVHFDCDLYESTRDALALASPAFQDGVMLMFDDWFHYRGNPHKGQSRAFEEFLAQHPEWVPQQYRSYSTFCNSFILSRRDA